MKKTTYFQIFMFTFSLVESLSLSRHRKKEMSEPRVVVWTKQKDFLRSGLLDQAKRHAKQLKY